MSYRLTVRRGPNVEKAKRETLAEALDLLEAYTRTAARREGVDFVSRRYEPGDLVAMRVELKGDGVNAGLDVHGDGSAVAWTGFWTGVLGTGLAVWAILSGKATVLYNGIDLRRNY